MRYATTSLLLIVLLYSISYSQDKSSIAVLELEAGGISAYEAQVLSNRLRTELFKTEKYTVLERDKMDEILIEQGFQLSACTTNECAVEVGKLIGVEKMVAGNIAKIDNLFTIDIRLIDVETGKVLKTATEDCACELKDVLTNSIRNVARSLAGLKVEDKIGNVKTYPSNNLNNSNSGISEWEMKGMTKEDYILFKKSGLNEVEWNSKIQEFDKIKKSAFSAGLKSILFSGWGQLSLERTRGYIYMGIEVIGWSAFIYSISEAKSWKDKKKKLEAEFGYESDEVDYAESQLDYYSDALLVRLAICIGLNRLISAIDAGYTTENYNNELKKKFMLSFSPTINRYSNQPMLSININF